MMRWRGYLLLQIGHGLQFRFQLPCSFLIGINRKLQGTRWDIGYLLRANQPERRSQFHWISQQVERDGRGEPGTHSSFRICITMTLHRSNGKDSASAVHVPAIFRYCFQAVQHDCGRVRWHQTFSQEPHRCQEHAGDSPDCPGWRWSFEGSLILRTLCPESH